MTTGFGTPAADAKDGGRGHGPNRPYTFAVIGDIPYGETQIARFPPVIAQINTDPAVQWVDHLGDIKSGSTVCSDAYFRTIRQQFDTFLDPLVYTVGDNEWTDCHRPSNGAYNPLERLAAIRSLFFPNPGQTLGQHPGLSRVASRPGPARGRAVGTGRRVVRRPAHRGQQQQPRSVDGAYTADP
ncbi:MAG: hypothetical protein ABJA87_04130 [bacterium]